MIVVHCERKNCDFLSNTNCQASYIDIDKDGNCNTYLEKQLNIEDGE